MVQRDMQATNASRVYLEREGDQYKIEFHLPALRKKDSVHKHLLGYFDFLKELERNTPEFEGGESFTIRVNSLNGGRDALKSTLKIHKGVINFGWGEEIIPYDIDYIEKLVLERNSGLIEKFERERGSIERAIGYERDYGRQNQYWKKPQSKRRKTLVRQMTNAGFSESDIREGLGALLDENLEIT